MLLQCWIVRVGNIAFRKDKLHKQACYHCGRLYGWTIRFRRVTLHKQPNVFACPHPTARHVFLCEAAGHKLRPKVARPGCPPGTGSGIAPHEAERGVAWSRQNATGGEEPHFCGDRLESRRWPREGCSYSPPPGFDSCKFHAGQARRALHFAPC